MFAWWSAYVTIIVTLERNIPLMRRQKTGITWNGTMLQADVTLLRTNVTLLPIHTCTQQHYVSVLGYTSVLTYKDYAKECIRANGDYFK